MMAGRERRIRVGGHEAHVVEMGSGPPVVILAAMLIMAGTYAPIIDRLRRRFQIFAVEMPGCGRGSRLSTPWSFEQYAAHGARLLEALGLERTTLVGHSNAGAVALIMGALHPERIAELVLVNSLGADPRGSVLALMAGHARNLPLEPSFAFRAAPALMYNLVQHPRDVVNQVQLAARENLTSYAARVAVRTLVGWGARDRTVPLCDAQVLHRLIPGSALHVSALGSHDWMIAEPSEFAEVFTAFTQGRGAAPQVIGSPGPRGAST
jgi:pimeloyl-ACP methyl ester carboxylesterase